MSLAGVGLVGVWRESSELLVSGVAGVGFAATYILSVFVSHVTQTFHKGAIEQGCTSDNFYKAHKVFDCSQGKWL